MGTCNGVIFIINDQTNFNNLKILNEFTCPIVFGIQSEKKYDQEIQENLTNHKTDSFHLEIEDVVGIKEIFNNLMSKLN